MKISNRDKIKLVMAKDWWETEDLDGKIGKVKVSEAPFRIEIGRNAHEILLSDSVALNREKA